MEAPATAGFSPCLLLRPGLFRAYLRHRDALPAQEGDACVQVGARSLDLHDQLPTVLKGNAQGWSDQGLNPNSSPLRSPRLNRSAISHLT